MGRDVGETRCANGRRRAYIRHPAQVPIEVTRIPSEAVPETDDVSHGGLAFTSDHALEVGTEVSIRVPEVDASFDARARVAWCRSSGGRYRVGVRFLHPEDAFHSRMVEQLCAIESYRRDVHARDGRDLSPEQAAREWIERHAGRFPLP